MGSGFYFALRFIVRGRRPLTVTEEANTVANS